MLAVNDHQAAIPRPVQRRGFICSTDRRIQLAILECDVRRERNWKKWFLPFRVALLLSASANSHAV